jgi:phosphoglycerate dehydrogenase-like enzyme
LVATNLMNESGMAALRASLPAGVSVERAPVTYVEGGLPAPVADEWRPLFARADIMLGFAQQLGDLRALAPRLQWVQHYGAGYESVPLDELEAAGIGFVSAAGAGARGIGEFVMMGLLTVARNGADHLRAQQAHQWARFPSSEVAGRRLTVFGAGEIGAVVCRLGEAFELDVTAVRLHPELGPPPGAARVVGPDDFDEVLERSELLVLSAPLTERTASLINEKTLARLPPGAILVNVARAGLVDHAALVAALRSGHLGGAWLDVLPEEPLGPESELWDAPRLCLSSHNAVATLSYSANVGRQLGAAVDDWLCGRPVAHVVLPLPSPPS